MCVCALLPLTPIMKSSFWGPHDVLFRALSFSIFLFRASYKLSPFQPFVNSSFASFPKKRRDISSKESFISEICFSLIFVIFSPLMLRLSSHAPTCFIGFLSLRALFLCFKHLLYALYSSRYSCSTWNNALSIVLLLLSGVPEITRFA